MWIKICANTNLDDARLAADLGAQAVGFVFAPSPRQVTPAQAAAITRHLPGVERIGVFVTQSAEEIAQAVQEAGLTGVQLHSRLNRDLVRRLRAIFAGRITLTQVVHWDATPDAPPPGAFLREQLLAIRDEPGIERVLIDSQLGAATGGTGMNFDWNAAADILKTELGDLKLIIAGGLRPANIAEAIQRLQPWGVDVASGVEASPGKKDPEKLEAFITKASH